MLPQSIVLLSVCVCAGALECMMFDARPLCSFSCICESKYFTMSPSDAESQTG